jgi:hypothetical protein
MEQFNEWSFSMPHKSKNAQAIGADALKETEHMDEGQAPKIHTLKVADDPEEFVDGLPEWVDGNTLIGYEDEAPEVLICGPDGEEEGGVLRLGSKLVVGGGSKMGKTWCLVDLALAVASGGKWLGHFQCRQGSVLYVNLELRRHTAGRRVRWIAEKRGLMQGLAIRPDVAKAIQTWNLRGQCYDLVMMLSTARQRLRDKDAPKFSLIILDPIYKCYGDKDENSAGDMAALMLEIERFADECNAAIAYAAHFSKGNQSGKEAMDRISGSGVMARDPDAIMTFTNHEEEDCYTLDAILREFAPIPPTVFNWQAPLMNPRTDLDPTKLKQPGKAAKTVAPQRAEAIRRVLEANDGSLPRATAIRMAVEAGGKKPSDPDTERAWLASLDRHKNALADEGIEEVAQGPGKSPILQIKVTPKKATRDPF